MVFVATFLKRRLSNCVLLKTDDSIYNFSRMFLRTCKVAIVLFYELNCCIYDYTDYNYCFYTKAFNG